MSLFTKKQFFILFLFAFLGSFFAIAHGVFFDLKLKEAERITLGGVVLTTLLLFIFLGALEYIFDLDNEERLRKLTKELEEIKKKVR